MPTTLPRPTKAQIDDLERRGILTARKAAVLREIAPPTPAAQIVVEGRPSLHAGQIEIKAACARFNVVNCGRRFGKSILGEDLAMDTALSGKPVGWFSPDYKSLLENWRNLCKLLAPFTSRKSELEKRIELTTGGIIEFWSLDSDPECSRGRKYARVIIDEAAKVRWLLRAWLEAIRANLTDYIGDAWFFSTPKGRNDYWELYQRENDPKHKHDWKSFKKPSSDNPHLPPGEVEALRLECGPRIASQEVDAEFLEVGGRFFDAWMPSTYQTETVHEVWADSINVGKHWRMEGGLDHGTANPYAFGLTAYDEQGNAFVVGESYGALKTNATQIQEIKQVIERWGRKCSEVTIWADPAIFPPKDPAKRVGKYTAEDFWDAGLHLVPANNARVDGWKRLKQYMMARAEVVDAQDKKREIAKLVIFKDRCPNLVRTIPLMVGTEREPEDCFIAGTLISTPDGDRRIEDLKPGDLVETPIGPSKVLESGFTGICPVYRLVTNDSELIGTSKHPIYLYNCFRPLHSLCSGDILLQRIICNQSSIKKSFTGVTIARTMRQMEQRSSKVAKNFMLKYTKTLTDQCQKALKFITRITIPIITLPIISKYCLADSTGLTTYRRGFFRAVPCMKSLKYGDRATKVNLFSKITPRKCMKGRRLLPLRAFAAAALSYEKLICDQNTVPFSARIRIVCQKTLALAAYAGLYFLGRKLKAGQHKHVRINAVGSLGVEMPVFNLKVEGAGVYYANGILVHNCDTTLEDHACDMLRYMIERPLASFNPNKSRGFKDELHKMQQTQRATRF